MTAEAFSPAEQAELEKLTKDLQAMPDPTPEELEQLNAAVGEDQDSRGQQVVNEDGEGEEASDAKRVRRAGRDVILKGDGAELVLYRSGVPSGTRKLFHGYRLDNDAVKVKYYREGGGKRFAGTWYWDNDQKEFVREKPGGGDAVGGATATEAAVGTGGDNLDEELRRAEAALAAERARAAALDAQNTGRNNLGTF